MLEPRQQHVGSALDLPGFSDDTEYFDEPLEQPTDKTPWWRQRRNIMVLSAVLLVVLVASVVTTVLATRAPQVTYQTAAASQGNLTVTVSATGPLQGAVYPINFSGSGRLTEIDATIGQQVQAGQVLARLDPTSLQDALNQAQAQLNSAQTSLNNAYTNERNVQEQTRAQVNAAYAQEQASLAKCATGDTNCVNTAQAQYASSVAQSDAQNASASSQVSSAQAQVNSAQTSLATAQHNLANATLTAPHAGIVASVNGVVGGVPGAGASSSSGSSSSGGGTFIEIVDLTAMQVSADVNEADIGKIAVGQTATFTVSAYGTQRFRGTVAAISPLGQNTSSVVTYPVTINVDMASVQSARLLPSMTANVTITTAQRIGVLVIPSQAVTYARSGISNGLITRADLAAAYQQANQLLAQAQSSDPTAQQDNLTAAYVLERTKAGKWVVKPVVLGLSNGTQDEVVSGLSDGESVVISQQGGASTSASTTSGSNGLLPGRGGGGFGGGRGGN